jgi:D-alanyl-D-alanine dipeptidase
MDIILIFKYFFVRGNMSSDTFQSLQIVLHSQDFVELIDSDYYVIDLKYATTDNFMNENVYKEFNRAFLHSHAAEKLEKAAFKLKELKPNYKFIIYDVLRPRSVQWKMWNKVKGTHQQQYIANPEEGSSHNYGMAVDLSILDDKGQVLDMGAGFDEFDDISQPQYESKFRAEKRLTSTHIENRNLLRACMEPVGFKQFSTEWWHFNALPFSEIRNHFKIVE